MKLTSTLAVAALCLTAFSAFAEDAKPAAPAAPAAAPAAAPSPEALKRMEACKADADKLCAKDVAAKAAGTGEKGAVGKCLDAQDAALSPGCKAARAEAKAAAPK